MAHDLLPSRGRPGGTGLIMTVERELTAEDIARLSSEPRTPVSVPPIQRLKASHHAAARHLASGKNVRETAFLVGCTPQRITQLQADPSFNHLCDYYREQVTEGSLQEIERVQTKLRILAETATDILQERLDDPAKAETLPIGELRQIGAFGFDRTVAPPKTANTLPAAPVNVTFNMGPRDIRKTIDQDGNEIPGAEKPE